MEALFFVAGVATVLMPILYGFVVLDKAAIIHRFFLHVLGIRLRLAVKILPILFLIMYYILQVGDNLFSQY